MADLGEGLYARLSGQAAIAAAVGTRIYRETLPQAASLPSILIHVPSDNPLTDLEGAVGHGFAMVEFYCLALTAAEAWQIRELVRDALIGYQGEDAGIYFRGCEPLGGRMDRDQPNEGSQAWRHMAIDEFRIGYQW